VISKVHYSAYHDDDGKQYLYDDKDDFISLIHNFCFNPSSDFLINGMP